MRIALVVPGGVDSSGRHRVIPLLLSFIARLARRHETRVYVLQYHAEPRSYSFLGATVHDLGSPSGVRRQYLALTQALHRHGPVDVLHGWWALPSGFVASVAGWRLGIPSIVTCDSGEFMRIPDIAYGSQLAWRQRLAVAATIRLATRLTVSTQYQSDRAKLCRAHPEIVPIGIDSELFVPTSRSEGAPWRLLHVASLNRVKDQTTLLRAFRQLIDRDVDATLDIAGEDTLSGAIQQLAGTLGIADRVTFHGVLDSHQLVSLYQRAHLLVVSSRHEAAGVVALEASACGAPVVGSSVGYLADWTSTGAVTVGPRDAGSLATAVIDLLRDRSKRERIAEWAREWTLAHDADWTAVQFERLYRDLIAGH